MDTIQQRLALKFRVSKIENSGIHAPILLNELFYHADKDTDARLVQGFLKIETPEELKPQICWHIWVVNGARVYDINKTLAIMKDPGFNNCKFDYSMSEKDIEVPEELNEQWKLYQEDKKEFWKKSPMYLKNFRAKVFKKL